MWTVLHSLNSGLPRMSQASFLRLMLQSLSSKHLHMVSDPPYENKLAVGAVASIISHLINDNTLPQENIYLQEQMIEWLTNTSSPRAVKDLETRRALIVVLAQNEGKSPFVLSPYAV